MNRQVGLLYDPAVLDHRPREGHPERPQRAQETIRQLSALGVLEHMVLLPVVPATREQIARVHAPAYLDRIEKIAARGGGLLDAGDTYASPGSWLAATTAAGAAIGAVDAVMAGTVESAFAVVRPPGHHALADRAMGFCLINNAAVAAAHAVSGHLLSRVLIVDFDVHHGNGTQEIFYEAPDVLYFSTHQSPAYPGTGAADEIGRNRGKGYTVNVPLPARTGDSEFLAAFDEVLIPLAARFQPELIVVSAGYDAHWRNSAYVNGIQERVTIDGFAALSDRLFHLAQQWCPGRLVGILEGGYDLDSLALGVGATLCSWAGIPQLPDSLGTSPDPTPEPDLSDRLEGIRSLHGL